MGMVNTTVFHHGCHSYGYGVQFLNTMHTMYPHLWYMGTYIMVHLTMLLDVGKDLT